MRLTIAYPACFYEDKESGAYAVEIPDLPGCSTGGNTLAEAIFMAVDAASGWVLDELEDGKIIPNASKIDEIIPDQGGFVSMIDLDLDAYAEKYGDNAIPKNFSVKRFL